MKRYANDPQYARIEREADLIAKAAVYHAVQLVRQPERNRPTPKDSMSSWLMGKRPSLVAG